MKPRETYRITAVRLVEFHNLGTTTIEIPDGGHLFLLGDNGSGKTTILDAIHLVLTAGREMEFNSAARVAGAKDSGGRTIQGIVLRYNAVTGRPMRETGISYAAVELRSDTGRVCSLAVGLSADGMDVAFERWGGIASVPVGELPLAVQEGGGLRVATQGEFKRGIASLAGGKHYAHINDYADAVGARMFGGAAKYADVCKLLRTGKAYREIAARAANYDDLFRKLLEDPDVDTFEPLLKGLRELEESKGRLEEIDDRANYLNDLRRESERLGRLRLRADLVSWSEAERRRAQAVRDAAEIASAETDGKERLVALESEWSALKDEVARGRERLAALRQKDSSGLIGREKSAAQKLAEAERKSQEAERVLSEARRGRSAAEKVERDVCAKCTAAMRRHADEVASAAKSADFAIGAVSDALYGGDAEKASLSGVFAAAEKSVSAERETRSGSAFSARSAADAARSEAEARRRELEEIRSRGESIPAVEGFAGVKSAMRSQMLSARPVYELLEPASGCDARHLAIVERLAGDDFLSTWLVKADEADQARRIAWREGSRMSVAVREDLADVSVNDLAPWLGSLVSFEESDVDAVKLLARHLADKTGMKDGDFLSLKTWRFRAREGLSSQDKPRLIGLKAREAEQARMEKAAESRLSEAERALKAAEKESAACARALECIRELEAKIGEAQRTVWREAGAVRDAKGALLRAAERTDAAQASAEERRREAESQREELEDIRVKMRAEGIDGSLERRISSAEKSLRQREADRDAAGERIGTMKGRLESLANARAEKEAVAQSAAARAEESRGRFAAMIPDGSDAAAFAKGEFPQCMDPRADFSALREEIAKFSGEAEAKIEQRIRDHKGEPFAFSFDKAANAITDRRGSPLAEVIADETRRLEELRGVLDQKSREVFERIFMGEVMRRLYMDLARITDLTGRIQRKLSGRRFGMNRYAFSISPVPEYEGFVSLVRRGYALDAGGEKDELRDYLLQHKDEILHAEIDTIPDIFDYRKWFRFELKVVTENDEGRVIDRKVKSMGSGGEQAVPNYLLILTVAEFLYHGGDGVEPPKTSPILFDEAFYGIDAARRDQLLAFAEDLGLQLFVSSPDQDGVKREIRHSVSLIVVKDENLDVHLTPVLWRNAPSQGDLLDGPADEVGMTVGKETK